MDLSEKGTTRRRKQEYNREKRPRYSKHSPFLTFASQLGIGIYYRYSYLALFTAASGPIPESAPQPS
jgi:hypothetical protein